MHHFCGGGGCVRGGRECMGSFVLPLSFALDLKLLQKKSIKNKKLKKKLSNFGLSVNVWTGMNPER